MLRASFARLKTRWQGRVFLIATLGATASLPALAWAQPSRTLDAPVSPNAQPEVRALLEFLNGLSGKMILSGQQETVDWFGRDNAPEFPFLLEKTGREPAVRGFDFIFYSDPRSVSMQTTATRMIAWAQRGGIVTSAFHWNAGSPRHSFYTADSDFDLAQALTPGTRDNAEFIAEMDIVAEELKKVRDARVPVIWRPFHECSGNQWGAWFWWGAKGAEKFKEAWRFMFDRFTRVHGLTNLIWCYNPTDLPGALEVWYPGDDYVDMISLDVYPATGTHPTFASEYRQFRNLRAGRKLVAMSENGAIPDPDYLWTEGAHWVYFCTWNGSFTTDGVVNPFSFLHRVYNHPRVITLDELAPIHPRLDRPPAIVVPPASASVDQGATTTLAVVASGSAPFTYRWRKNGAEIGDAREAALRLSSVSVLDAGTYTVEVSNSAGTATSEAATLAVSGTAFVMRPSQIVNLSTRGLVRDGNEVMIAGLVVGGQGAKRLLLRAIGPTLRVSGVTTAMSDPKITLTKPDGTWLASNDDWAIGTDAAALEAVFTQTYAFGLDRDSRDAALVATLPPGNYTAIVSAADTNSGVALVEVYDADAAGSPARLVNISTRGPVGTGNEVMIAGFVVGGAGSSQLLVRAVGPALAPYLTGSLANPELTLTTQTGAVIATNDDWGADGAELARIKAAAAIVSAFGLPDVSADSGLLTLRPAGGYTAIVRGNGGTTGIALAEIYEVP
jgi:hypothetical protein